MSRVHNVSGRSTPVKVRSERGREELSRVNYSIVVAGVNMVSEAIKLRGLKAAETSNSWKATNTWTRSSRSTESIAQRYSDTGESGETYDVEAISATMRTLQR